MERADKNLAFMLQYENIAWYENGKVRILDRRIYPTKVEFVECTTHQEVTQAQNTASNPPPWRKPHCKQRLWMQLTGPWIQVEYLQEMLRLVSS